MTTQKRAGLVGATIALGAAMLIGAPVRAQAAESPLTPIVQSSAPKPMLTARVGRWQGESAKKRKGPKGFDVQFRLVGLRFDGTFGVEGVPQTVPEGEAFDAQIKLTNIGGKKHITVSSVTVTGEGVTLNTELLNKKVDPKTAVTVASFKVPAQSSAGSNYLITVVLSNGDKHAATLSFSPAS